MTKKEKREYLKPYRCLGGYMLFTGIFSAALTSATASLQLVINKIINNSELAFFLAESIAYGVIVYSYYVGYRIFVKKYVPKIIELNKVKKWYWCLLEMILCFVLIRYCWYFWSVIMESMGWIEAAEMDLEMHLMGMIYAGIIAPIAEEMLFRGFLLKMLRRYSALVAIVFTSVSFGIFHGTLAQAVPAMFIGIILAVLDLRYDSILPSIILHMATNILSLVEIYVPIHFPFDPLINLYIFAGLSVLGILLNIKHITRQARNIKTVLRLSYTSIAFIVFIVGYTALIVLQALF
ncbi:MAG: CPBP family intramembrane metalloprotease [Erysipelotrichaceae bacterium]|nr:CPBP family intramembrane metalloprotease [Erysipelotrichaceae bacterium]